MVDWYVAPLIGSLMSFDWSLIPSSTVSRRIYIVLGDALRQARVFMIAPPKKRLPNVCVCEERVDWSKLVGLCLLAEFDGVCLLFFFVCCIENYWVCTREKGNCGVLLYIIVFNWFWSRSRFSICGYVCGWRWVVWCVCVCFVGGNGTWVVGWLVIYSILLLRLALVLGHRDDWYEIRMVHGLARSQPLKVVVAQQLVEKV